MHLNRKAEVPKPTDLNYRIGLDIGIASVGWAVLENNTHDEPFRIIDLGVRILIRRSSLRRGRRSHCQGVRRVQPEGGSEGAGTD